MRTAVTKREPADPAGFLLASAQINIELVALLTIARPVVVLRSRRSRRGSSCRIYEVGARIAPLASNRI